MDEFRDDTRARKVALGSSGVHGRGSRWPLEEDAKSEHVIRPDSSRKHLYDVATKLVIEGRSSRAKQLVAAIRGANMQATTAARG